MKTTGTDSVDELDDVLERLLISSGAATSSPADNGVTIPPLPRSLSSSLAPGLKILNLASSYSA